VYAERDTRERTYIRYQGRDIRIMALTYFYAGVCAWLSFAWAFGRSGVRAFGCLFRWAPLTAQVHPRPKPRGIIGVDDIEWVVWREGKRATR
jgi:hypothetical protein